MKPSGREALGWGPFYRCYEAEDGWFFLAAPTERDAIFAIAPELNGLAGLPENELEQNLSERFAARPVAYWQRTLSRGATAVTPLASMLETRDQALQIESKDSTDIAQATYRAVRHDLPPDGALVRSGGPQCSPPGKCPDCDPRTVPKIRARHAGDLVASRLYG